MDRRSALAVLLSPAFAALWRRAAADAPEMRITHIDTVYWESRDDAPFWPHWTSLRLHTDTGLVGLGETSPRNPHHGTVAAPDLPGFGMRVKPEVWEHPKAVVRTSLA